MSTKIEWCDESWNPVSGCSPVSAGCANCYARRMATRLRGRFGYPSDDPFRVTLHHDALDEPLHWRKPRFVFVCSMGDLFHEDVPREFIKRVAGTFVDCPQHTFLLLTTRADRMEEFVGEMGGLGPNVWGGVSVEDQESAEKRIPHLLATQFARRYVSYEPALGPVDFEALNHSPPHRFEPGALNALSGEWWPAVGDQGEEASMREDGPGLDWIVAGGETGPGARPSHPDWFRSVRDQCVAAGVPFFFKSWGDWVPETQIPWLRIENRGHHYDVIGGVDVVRVGKKAAGRELDGRTWDERPPCAS